VVLAAACPTAITLVMEWFTPIPVSNAARAVAGFIAAAGIAAFVFVSAPESSAQSSQHAH
jgi:hypothetical protein